MTIRKPAVLISCGLILGLSAAAALLLHLYSQASARHFDPALPPLPPVAQLLAATRQFDPTLASPDLRLIHETNPLPRSGLLQLYRVSDDGRPVYALALVRHDIPCGTCRDLLAAVYLDPRPGRSPEWLPWKPGRRRTALSIRTPSWRN